MIIFRSKFILYNLNCNIKKEETSCILKLSKKKANL